jgi:hypothetical protein
MPFVVNPLFFAPFALFAVKSSPPIPAPGSSEGGHAGPPLPYNLFYALFVVKSCLFFDCGPAALSPLRLVSRFFQLRDIITQSGF